MTSTRGTPTLGDQLIVILGLAADLAIVAAVIGWAWGKLA